MRNLTKLACCGAALAQMLVVTDGAVAGKPGAAPKPVTQACTLTGDATGGGTVGITASSRGPLEMTIKVDMQLATTFSALGGAGTYEGSGRVLKKEGRLDFWFDVPARTCRPLEWGEEFPPADDDVCCYELLLLNGVYDRKKDTVSFGSGTTAQLVDYCAPAKISPEGATASLLVSFSK
jgi:hypothetical protein